MNTPGFTAEASLSGQYGQYSWRSSGREQDQVNAGVIPALPPQQGTSPLDRFHDCVDLCITRGGTRDRCKLECHPDPSNGTTSNSRSGGGVSGFTDLPDLLGEPSIYQCWFELATHPVGYNVNRKVIRQLKDEGTLQTKADCYSFADTKGKAGLTIAGGLGALNKIAGAIALLGTYNAWTMTKCVCNEYQW